MNRDKELIKLLKNLAGISEGCKPRMSIEQVKKEIKALYKPLGKEELEEIIYPELVLIITTQNKDKHFDCINNNKISANATNQIADAIINARGE